MKSKPKITFTIETYGCPYVASVHDDFGDFKEDKFFGIKKLHKNTPLKNSLTYL
jgi:hypothetical protein